MGLVLPSYGNEYNVRNYGSKILTTVNATVRGVSTIRSARANTFMLGKFQEEQDRNTSYYFMYLATNRWFALWLEITSIIYLTLIILTLILLGSKTMIGNIGLSISSVMALNLNFQLGMRASAEMENNMVSAERILGFSFLEREKNLAIAKSPSFKCQGSIKFENVSLSYGKKKVIKDISFSCEPGTKIGIVGRTGAGKSSIVNCLLQLGEVDGTIYIDGINSSLMNLAQLRESVVVVPQKPCLFKGSLRFNLDPFNLYKDDHIWSILEMLNLKEIVQGNLMYLVSGGGSNFSTGQKQLFCLARGLLRGARIIVLDESTSNMDKKTDEQTREVVKTTCIDCTILTIAHRIDSVLDSDKVLAMGEGQILEFDDPKILLAKEDSVLYRLCNGDKK